MRARVLLLFTILLAVAVPASAQEDELSPLDYVPADYAGMIRLDLQAADETLQELNAALYVGSFIQPRRLAVQQRQTFAAFFPLDLLDVENVTFESLLLPWIDGEIIIAYREFDERLGVAPENLLVVLPTDDPFGAASVLAPVIQGQDFLERTRYHDVPVYIGDRTAVALTPNAVLLGSESVLRSSLDAVFGDAERLADQPSYQAALAAAEDDPTVFAYLAGNDALNALSFALQGDTSATPLLGALGSVLEERESNPLQSRLLSSEVEAIGLGLDFDIITRVLRASAAVSVTGDAATDPAVVDQQVLAFLPRSAMLVHSGTDARSAFQDAVRALPLTGFSGYFIGAFSPLPAQAIQAPVATPTAEDLRAAVDSFITTLSMLRGFDLDSDLAAYLEGSYAVGIIPRPNNPSLVTGLPYDLLIVARVSDADAAAAGVRSLLQAVLALEDDMLVESEVAGAAVTELVHAPTGEPVVRFATVNDLLVAGTGSAVEQALRAHAGDNRLVNMPRWQALRADGRDPSLYVDLNAVHTTFLPALGGPVSQGIGQLGASVDYVGDGTYRLDITVTIP